MEIIIFLLIIWLILSILKRIFTFLFGSSSSSNSNKKIYGHLIEGIDEGPSDLKYKNGVYVSFRNKVQKAYESFKQSGHKVVWDSNIDGFYIFEGDSLSIGSSIYTIYVQYDKKNVFKLDDPFIIFVSYGYVFLEGNYRTYKEQADYINDYFYKEKRPGVFFHVDKFEDSDLGIYYTDRVISNNKNLCEETERLGEAEVFRQVISETKQTYREGEEVYHAKILEDIKKLEEEEKQWREEMKEIRAKRRQKAQFRKYIKNFSK